MKEQFLAFFKKEWFHIIRDRKTLFILFGLPVAQIMIFGFALTNEIKNSRVSIVDMAGDEMSAKLIERISASRYFDLHDVSHDPDGAHEEFRKGHVRLIVVIPENFSRELLHLNRARLQVLADASDPNTGTALDNYLRAVVADFQQDINRNRMIPLRITSSVRMLYNPQLKGAYNFVPGVMAMVLMLVCTLMTSIAIVREKETGTMEVMLISPMKPVMVILSKSAPYLLLSAVNIASILLLSVFVLGLPIAGSLSLLILLSLLYTLTCLSLGMLISSITASQQVAMMISLVALFLPTLMLSGFMFPIENMPLPLKALSHAVPARWYFFIVKEVMIKGAGVWSIWKEALILTGMTAFFLIVSIRKFSLRLNP